MNEELNSQVAASLDATPELLPFIPELLADVWALGGSPETLVELLHPLGLSGPATRLLDLGCGKGAMSVTVASALGCCVHGVDGFGPFIDEAAKRAEDFGVAGLCEFECGDMRETVRTARDYDVVVFVANGPMLDGKPCVDRLRQCVRSGGYIVLDDGFLPDGAARSKLPGYEAYLPHDETIRRLTAHGDMLVRELVSSAEEADAVNTGMTDKIRQRAAGLAERHPESADLFSRYVQNQERECELLRKLLVPAIWLLQRV